MKRSRLNPVNGKRKRRLLAVQFGKQAEHCRQAACCVCFQPGPSHPHHVRSRGAGGLDADTVPLCPGHHAMVHSWGVKTFIRETGVDLYQVAKGIAQEIAGRTGDGPAADRVSTASAAGPEIPKGDIR